MDREERKYQKAMMICVQGIGASLNSSVEALDVVDGLGQSHHESLRSTKWELWGKESVSTPIPNIQTMGFSYTTNIDSSECTGIFPEG